MTHFQDKLQNEVRHLRLTDQEKSAMRAQLFDVMNPPAVVTPYVFVSRISLAFTAFLFVLVGGGSYTAFAAKGALPGDILYPIKLSVNETVEGALAFSPEAKAQFYANLTERRVEEAEVLASNGKLNAAVATQISEHLGNHATEAQALAAVIAQKDPGIAAQISTKLASALEVHDTVLTALGDTSTSTEVKQNTSKLALEVRGISVVMAALVGGTKPAGKGDQGPVIAMAKSAVTNVGPDTGGGMGGAVDPTNGVAAMSLQAPASIDEPVAPAAVRTMMVEPAADTAVDAAVSVEAQHATDTQMRTATRLQASATAQLATARALFAKFKPTISASAAARIEARFADVDQLVAQGSAQLASGSYDEATARFTEALRASTLVATYLTASKNFAPAATTEASSTAATTSVEVKINAVESVLNKILGQ